MTWAAYVPESAVRRPLPELPQQALLGQRGAVGDVQLSWIGLCRGRRSVLALEHHVLHDGLHARACGPQLGAAGLCPSAARGHPPHACVTVAVP